MLEKHVEALKADPHLESKFNASQKFGKLTALELKNLKELLTLLGQFKLATDAFQKDTDTVGLVIPVYLKLLNCCDGN